MSQRIGAWGEHIACRFLADRGFVVRDRNWRCASGEIDLVAQDGEEIIFVEVRTRHSADFGAPEETVTPRKRQALIAAAQHYLAAHNLHDKPWRIDFVAVELDARNAVRRIEHIPCAIQAS
ncbi:MAG: YraN family protein [Anaerolineae bacterium]|nr:YraN family protein [Anaerolineae bacterium]